MKISQKIVQQIRFFKVLSQLKLFEIALTEKKLFLKISDSCRVFQL